MTKGMERTLSLSAVSNEELQKLVREQQRQIADLHMASISRKASG